MLVVKMMTFMCQEVIDYFFMFYCCHTHDFRAGRVFYVSFSFHGIFYIYFSKHLDGLCFGTNDVFLLNTNNVPPLPINKCSNISLLLPLAILY